MTTMTADKFGQSGPSAAYAVAYNKVMHRATVAPGSAAEAAAEAAAHAAGIKAHLESVWGPDYKLDRNGKPISTAIGAIGFETGNHFASILRYEGKEAHQRALREIWKRDPAKAKELALPEPERLGA